MKGRKGGQVNGVGRGREGSQEGEEGKWLGGAGTSAQDHTLGPLSQICGFCKLQMSLVQGIRFCQDELICRGELMGWTERHKTIEREVKLPLYESYQE